MHMHIASVHTHEFTHGEKNSDIRKIYDVTKSSCRFIEHHRNHWFVIVGLELHFDRQFTTI